VALKPWGERKLDAKEILAKINGALVADVPEAMAFASCRPLFPVSQFRWILILDSRSQRRFSRLPRSESAEVSRSSSQATRTCSVGSQFSAAAPQIYADVDRDKVMKQGLLWPMFIRRLQAYLGGLFLNQFNRFGRQWRVFLQAEGDERLSDRDIEQYYVRNNDGNMVPLSALVTTRKISGPEYTNRFNVYRAPK